MDVLLRKLNEVKASIEETLAARSPLEKYEDAEDALRNKWTEELKAAVEAEYRRQRADFLLALQWWLRDVWLQTLSQVQTINHQLSTIHSPEALLAFPQLAGTKRVAERITPRAAIENLRIIEQLQRWLHTNAQEALALEVGLLKLQL
jgi:hypothetical protein